MINIIIIIIGIENIFSDCDQLTHQYEANSVILFVHMMDSSVSFGFTNFAYIFYLWKCYYNLSLYSTYIGYVHMYNTIYNLSVNGCSLLMGVVYYKWRPIISRMLYWLKVFVV